MDAMRMSALALTMQALSSVMLGEALLLNSLTNIAAGLVG